MRSRSADRNSIVIWTRTTARPEMPNGDASILASDGDKPDKTSKTRDEAKLLAAQIPEGAELAELVSGCPGIAGEVRLTYFPATKRQPLKSTPWQTTEADNDFTAQWTLEDLIPGKQYAAVIEARPIGSDDVTAVLRREFKNAATQSKPEKRAGPAALNASSERPAAATLDDDCISLVTRRVRFEVALLRQELVFINPKRQRGTSQNRFSLF